MCKHEEIGNCDEKTKNQEYCIFHKPKKNEQEAREFYEKFLRRFNPERERITVKGREVERFIFEREVDCRGFVFPEIPKDFDFSFENAVFKKDASFEDATFEGGASFRGATFEGRAWFWDATFEGEAWFLGAKFEGEASFSGATFEGVAWFEGATFKRVASFLGATFEGGASFRGATFEGEVAFNYTTFEEIAHFRGKKDNKKYKFYSELSFLNTVFRKGIDIEEPISKGWFKLPRAKAEACRVQRISYENEGRKDDADRIFVIERRSLREAKLEDAKEAKERAKGAKSNLKAVCNLIKACGSYVIEWFLADLTCEYGTNWKRPVVLWISAVLIVFPFLYVISGGFATAAHSTPTILNAIYFSIVTATTLGYGDVHPIGLGKAFASAEAVFGTLMWAVFLAVFARKYMR